jgi:hypothetical protein
MSGHKEFPAYKGLLAAIDVALRMLQVAASEQISQIFLLRVYLFSGKRTLQYKREFPDAKS